VTVLARSRFLSMYPEAFGERLAQVFEHEGIEVLRQHAAQRVYRDHEGLFVVQAAGPHRTVPVVSEKVLLATGRKPALGSLNLAAAGIELDGEALQVGEDMRVAGQPHIFAAGDVIGRRMVVHLAHIEAGIAATNAVNESADAWSRRANLEVVFSDPEFAFAGLSADQARGAGHNVATASRESRFVGKLHLAGDELGFGELVADLDTHVLLGAGLLCKSAGELIHLPAYLIEHCETAHAGAMSEFYHPTKSELVGGMLDSLCKRFGESPPRRADE
jgi:pyruvate/2-oxoglutarate dehydrogenase complex dihydrolipoamide dehydrogenase (E3) component